MPRAGSSGSSSPSASPALDRVSRLGRDAARCLLLASLFVAPLMVAPTEAATRGEHKFLPEDEKGRKQFKSLVQGARAFFDLNERIWTGRKQFHNELKKFAAKDTPLMKDMNFVRWLVAQSRSFEPQMDDVKWRKHFNVQENFSAAYTGFELKGSDLWIHIREPQSYPRKNKALSKYPRPGPWPAIYSLHNKTQAVSKGAGNNVVEAYWTKAKQPEIFENWFIAVPIASAGKFVSNDGRLDSARAMQPLVRVWTHYHIDFDRIILEGEQAALTMLSGQPVFFAGAILRQGMLDSPLLKNSVVNYAHIPLYVVKRPELAKELRAAGHPNVTEGEDAGLVAWLKERKRVEPTKFRWNIIDESAQQLAWWINADSVNMSASERYIEAEVLDTEKDPNTIRIKAVGVHDMTIYVNDDLVDMDRPVRVEINDQVIRNAVFEVPEQLKAFGRDLRYMFNRPDFRIRQSRYYGWLRAAAMTRVPVPAAKVPEKPTGPAATADEEAQAAKFRKKIELAIEGGDTDRAKRLLVRLCELPRNAQSAWAKEQAEKLGVPATGAADTGDAADK